LWVNTMQPPPPAPPQPEGSFAGVWHLSLGSSDDVLLSAAFMGAVDFGTGPLLSTAVPVVDANGDPLPEYAGCCVMEEATALVMLDSSGHPLWSKRIGQTEVACAPACDAMPWVMTLASADRTADGGIIVSGRFQGTIDLGNGPLVAAAPPKIDGPYDGLVAKLDPDGNELWSLAVGPGLRSGVQATVDGAGDLVVTGYFQGTLDFAGTTLTSHGGYDLLVAKLDPDGHLLWAESFGSSGDDWDNSTGRSAPDGSITLVVHPAEGQAIDFGAGPVGAGAAFVVVRLASDGALAWTHEVTTTGTWHDATLDVGVAGEVVLGGRFDGSVDFGAGPVQAEGPVEFFLARLSADGSLLWSRRFRDAVDSSTQCGPYGCIVADLRLDPAGRSVLTGSFAGSLDFGSGPLQSQGKGDGFFAKLCP
jgi:hypothetical protein